MGDAGPPTTPTSQRTVHVLVTGFGTFRSSANNPSWLIAASLPSQLDTKSHNIQIHTYPQAVRVSYRPTAELIPILLDPATNLDGIDYDFIFHIGLAAGRDSYTLETVAHRDDYIIPDVDGCDGYQGSKLWQHQGVPEALDVGWNTSDVLSRWESEVAGWEGPGKVRRPVVKLSRDAGRYLCEFIMMNSLVWRWRRREAAREKVGAVAFMHVPNGSGADEVARGRLVAEGAIRSLVDSWGEGFRNEMYAKDEAYESRGTGDAVAS